MQQDAVSSLNTQHNYITVIESQIAARNYTKGTPKKTGRIERLEGEASKWLFWVVVTVRSAFNVLS